MISYIIGEIKYIGEDNFVIENNNIGYFINSSFNTIKTLEINNEFKIFTKMNVREDDISLFGFSSKDELEVFELLTSVSTIGPKNAIAILSTLNVDKIKLAIVNNDIDTLTKAKGIGKKTASRIILELVDKVKKMAINDDISISNPDIDNITSNGEIEVAREALLNLGYQRNSIDKVLASLKDSDLSLEEIIKESLKRMI
ncbi:MULTISPECIES: Holliday junction branch migration protein RuvA [Anaerococcus]|uniref:Holliday junction branch migration protein RuvA n=1 Tax=Anaerococcus TaxID=165779 RepID=UPI0008A5F70F|nr:MULTISPECIES: Holliday junction branch migration protein RuvA [Anaerococcus]MDD7765740.1 Holliday junction branch migration protein RuvA [Anaerococcus vaginalis]MDU5085560.1 Holliday junction branch migration protein RuvA [Anaerococcus vaginalis]MDU5460665.1 Holliday junction branch migration protein RuvA [Anaerococcus vaginalis]MDU5823524.1 Holliday junction branch migration protein RuvA [Anaerococcus vaginalis]MDU6181075.1 Holliday junction branch migration protein RuvA [Anaerococcus vagi